MYDNLTDPKVKVCWDAMPDFNGGDSSTDGDQILCPSKWDKDVVGAWRMDVNVEVSNNCETVGSESKHEGIVKLSVRVAVTLAMTTRAMVRAIIWEQAKVRVRLRVNTKVIDYNCV